MFLPEPSPPSAPVFVSWGVVRVSDAVEADRHGDGRVRPNPRRSSSQLTTHELVLFLMYALAESIPAPGLLGSRAVVLHLGYGGLLPCSVPGVTSAGYYACRPRGPSLRSPSDAELSRLGDSIYDGSLRTAGRRGSTPSWLEAGILPSMGRRGDAFDKAVADGFLATLEDRAARPAQLKTRDHTRLAL